MKALVRPNDLEEVLKTLQEAGYIQSYILKETKIHIFENPSRRVEAAFFSESVSEPILSQLRERKKSK